MKSSQFLTESLSTYLTEDLKRDPAMRAHIRRLDEGFYKPWVRYINEGQQLDPKTIEQIFTRVAQTADASGGNLTGLGKIVDKIVPDALLAKLFQNLPKPDPNAQPDPEFRAKADAAIGKLPVDSATKQGLGKVVQQAEKNPMSHAIILALLGGVLGGILNKVGPMLSVMIPGGGTAVAGITGAVVAGTVAIAAAKLNGSSWKDAFKGAVKPALAGGIGAVLGSLAAQFTGAAIDHFMNPADAQTTTGGLDPNDPDVAEFNQDVADASGGTGANGFPTQDTRQVQLGPNETMSELADRLGTTVPELAKLNPEIANVHRPPPGATINVPMDPGTHTNPYGDAGGMQLGYDKAHGANPYYKGAGADPAAYDNYITKNPGSATMSPEQFQAQQNAGGGMITLSNGQQLTPDQYAQFQAMAQQAMPAYRSDTTYSGPQGSTTYSTRSGNQSLLREARLRYIDREQTVRTWMLRESLGKPRKGVHLTNEGIGDMFKKAGDFIKKGVQNKMKTVTADKLMMAWGKTGNSPDSDDVYNVMINNGVAKEFADKIYNEMGIPLPAGAAQGQAQAGAGAAGAAGAGGQPGQMAAPGGAAAGAEAGGPGAGGPGAGGPGAGGPVDIAALQKALDAALGNIGKTDPKEQAGLIKFAGDRFGGIKLEPANDAGAGAGAGGNLPPAGTAEAPGVQGAAPAGGAAPAAPGKKHTGGRQKGTLSTNPRAVKRREANAAKRKQATPAAPAPAAPAAAPAAHPADDNPNIQLGYNESRRTYGGRYIREAKSTKLHREFEKFVDDLGI